VTIAMETVGSAMLRHPTVHAPDLTVGEAQEIFATSPKTHLLVLVRDGVLVSTLVRDDVDGLPHASAPAADAGTLAGRTVTADEPLEALRAAMADSGLRRLAVVDDRMRLLGLLCLKRSRTGFCTDEGVAAMRAERRTQGPAHRSAEDQAPGR
jgi:CBS domain-containing protein